MVNKMRPTEDLIINNPEPCLDEKAAEPERGGLSSFLPRNLSDDETPVSYPLNVIIHSTSPVSSISRRSEITGKFKKQNPTLC